MEKAGTRKKPKMEVLTWDDLFKKDEPYEGPSPNLRASKMERAPVRKRSEIIVTTRTFKEMPNGDLIMEVSRHTEPVPKGKASGLDPADIRTSTDALGQLYLVQPSEPARRPRSAGKGARKRRRA